MRCGEQRNPSDGLWPQPATPVLNRLAQIILAADGTIDMAQAVTTRDGRLVGIARALARSPHALLLDEPAAGLDPAETSELGDLLRHVAKQRHIGILLVEHDIALVARICDHVVALDFGRAIEDGPPTAVLKHIDVRATYLGVA